ncbi:hypothetical protein COLO4_08940 [Corchorus olitorius]|uniref:Uncharacterized protein n=1 Tax=Corchorus olitorius TaxID=93759 RepID=A0A1R3KDY4_9ROSI|nr:hypothetical protein COLO4_08940 [Corchorus olitorius]
MKDMAERKGRGELEDFFLKGFCKSILFFSMFPISIELIALGCCFGTHMFPFTLQHAELANQTPLRSFRDPSETAMSWFALFVICR